jgi:hypothetical protein
LTPPANTSTIALYRLAPLSLEPEKETTAMHSAGYEVVHFMVFFFPFLLWGLMLCFFALLIVVAYFLYEGLTRIPEEYRSVEPFFAWLIIIPVAGIAFIWILFPFKIPESLKSYFENTRDIPPDSDYGRKTGMACAILLTISALGPLVIIGIIPAAIFLLLYLKQFREWVDKLPPKTAKTAQAPANRYEQLDKLKKLLDDGAITQEEFDAEKRKLLGRD